MRETIKGIIYSIILHIAFIFLFYSINISLATKEPEFVEVSFAMPPPAYGKKKIKKDKIELPKIQYPKEDEKIYEPKEIEKKFVEPVESEKYTPGVGEDVITEAYTIIGEIAKRKVIYKKIPKYPEGYNIQTKVSVRVFVSPDGTVNRLQLVKKGGPPFDEITKEALMEWKFAPLPQNLPQKVQQGIITFIYKLK